MKLDRSRVAGGSMMLKDKIKKYIAELEAQMALTMATQEDSVELVNYHSTLRLVISDLEFMLLESKSTAAEIATMITNGYGEEFLGEWYYNKELNQFDCGRDDYEHHSISPRYEHIKNLWTLNLDVRIKTLIFFREVK